MLAFVLWYGLLFLSVFSDIVLYMHGFHTAAIIVSVIIGIFVGMYIGVTLFLRLLCGSSDKHPNLFWQ